MLCSDVMDYCRKVSPLEDNKRDSHLKKLVGLCVCVCVCVGRGGYLCVWVEVCGEGEEANVECM